MNTSPMRTRHSRSVTTRRSSRRLRALGRTARRGTMRVMPQRRRRRSEQPNVSRVQDARFVSVQPYARTLASRVPSHPRLQSPFHLKSNAPSHRVCFTLVFLLWRNTISFLLFFPRRLSCAGLFLLLSRAKHRPARLLGREATLRTRNVEDVSAPRDAAAAGRALSLTANKHKGTYRPGRFQLFTRAVFVSSIYRTSTTSSTTRTGTDTRTLMTND